MPQKVFVPLAILKLSPTTIAPLHFARETYIKKLAQYGLEPVFVSALFSDEMVEDAYRASSGVFLMGGSDIDPKRYGDAPHAKAEVNEPARDELEIGVIRRALEDRKPIFAICRGVQALAVASGGSLYQHVPDIAPQEDHGARSYDDLATREKHPVILEEGSRVRALLGKDWIMVNSAHHQAVKDPGKDLAVSGRSPGNVTEILEHVDPAYFCFGVQSHPETEVSGDLEPLFGAFRDAVEK